MKVFEGKNVPIKSWCENPEQGALDQAYNLANLPFIFKHVALMPDTHQGYGMPIGGVIATKGVIIPNAVGSDISCGMCAVKTSLKIEQLDIDTLKKIMGEIRKAIPVGFNHHKEDQDAKLMPIFPGENGDLFIPKNYKIIGQQYHSALKQLGTLGGGNHFIEIQKDTENNIWIMIHSGSRNLGFKVANHYNKLAKELNQKWFSSIDSKWDLAFLPLKNDEAQCYLLEMQYCTDFALANRKLMMDRIKDIFEEIIPNSCSNVDGKMINIAHNYAKMENHFGQNVMVHRKGATSAKKNLVGIIPGSQGTSSYIVKGKGERDSFESCSHGAGRKMGRKDATRRLNLQEEVGKLNDQGIIHSIRNTKDLDEASGAYKDIDTVMEEQKDLVEILVKLQPLAVIKG